MNRMIAVERVDHIGKPARFASIATVAAKRRAGDRYGLGPLLRGRDRQRERGPGGGRREPGRAIGPWLSGVARASAQL